MAPVDRGKQRSLADRGCWSPLNIVAILAGFLVFWPLGAFFLIWAILGKDVSELAQLIGKELKRLTGWAQTQSPSGNRVFDEYEQTQRDRIDEIRKEINERRREFRRYKTERDRSREKEEFDEFMKRKPAASGESGDS